MMCFVNAANMANIHYKYIIQVSHTYNTNTVLLILLYKYSLQKYVEYILCMIETNALAIRVLLENCHPTNSNYEWGICALCSKHIFNLWEIFRFLQSIITHASYTFSLNTNTRLYWQSTSGKRPDAKLCRSGGD